MQPVAVLGEDHADVVVGVLRDCWRGYQSLQQPVQFSARKQPAGDEVEDREGLLVREVEELVACLLPQLRGCAQILQGVPFHLAQTASLRKRTMCCSICAGASPSAVMDHHSPLWRAEPPAAAQRGALLCRHCVEPTRLRRINQLPCALCPMRWPPSCAPRRRQVIRRAFRTHRCRLRSRQLLPPDGMAA